MFSLPFRSVHTKVHILWQACGRRKGKYWAQACLVRSLAQKGQVRAHVAFAHDLFGLEHGTYGSMQIIQQACLSLLAEPDVRGQIDVHRLRAPAPVHARWSSTDLLAGVLLTSSGHHRILLIVSSLVRQAPFGSGCILFRHAVSGISTIKCA